MIVPEKAWKAFDRYIQTARSKDTPRHEQLYAAQEQAFVFALDEYHRFEALRVGPTITAQRKEIERLRDLISDAKKVLFSLSPHVYGILGSALLKVGAEDSFEVLRKLEGHMRLATTIAAMEINKLSAPKGTRPEAARDGLVKDLSKLFKAHRAKETRAHPHRRGDQKAFVNDVLASLGKKALRDPTESVKKGQGKSRQGKQT